MWIVLFLLLPLAGFTYAVWHIWCILPFAPTWRIAVLTVGVSAFLAFILNFSRTIDDLPLWLASACYEIGNSFIFVLLYVVMAFLLLDIGRLVHVVPRSWLYDNGMASAIIFVLMAGLFTYGNMHYRNKVRQPLEIDAGGTAGKEMKVVMMSDMHLGYHNRRKELARWVDMVNAENPDLVLIAGDIVDISLRPLLEEDVASELRRIDAPVYACLGNHEYYSGVQRVEAFLRSAGIMLLRDSVATIGRLCVIGRDDRSNPHRRSMAELMRMAGDGKFTVVLDHQPYHLERAEKAGVDFQLSGHTHHGQLWPISWITESIYECAFGSWQRGNTRYYVSSGIGIWGGKFRIGTCSEYVVATIRGL